MALGRNLKLDRLIPLDQLNEQINAAKEKEVEVNQDSETSSGSVVSIDLTEQVERVESVKQEVEPTDTLSYLASIETDNLKVEFVPSKRKTQKRVFANITGNLSVVDAELLKSRIPSLFAYFDHVELNLTDITGLDTSIIQLFNLMRVQFHSLGKFTYINAELPKEIRVLLTTCGFSEFSTQKIASN